MINFLQSDTVYILGDGMTWRGVGKLISLFAIFFVLFVPVCLAIMFKIRYHHDISMISLSYHDIMLS